MMRSMKKLQHNVLVFSVKLVKWMSQIIQIFTVHILIWEAGLCLIWHILLE
jgi:hypothetical protein